MSIRPKEQVGLLVLDLDNTVWDWFDAWFKSFSALLEGLQRDTGLSLETLKNEMRTVHQNRGTTEYSLLLDELPSLQPFLGNQTVRERFDNALHEQNSKRKHETRLYPGVMTTLQHVKARGVKIIAYTESLSYWTEWRIKLTGLDGVIDFLYSSPDHDFPAGVTAKSIRTLPKGEYGLKTTQHRHVPRGVSKPDPRILEEIIAEHGEGSQGVAYVGDSLMKDIAMAQTVGVFDVHAAYGEAFRRKEYSLLQELSHWSDATVKKEQSTRRGAHPTPTYALKHKFSELLELFDFGPPLDVASHLAIWNTTVGVQQHFNDIGWRIRALGLTALTFTLGATGVAYTNAAAFVIGSRDVSPAVFVPMLGLVLWCSFWFMDAFWFHRLLIGSVLEGARLERLLRGSRVQVDLGGSISRSSPTWFPRVKRGLHSTGKLHLFYAAIAVLLLAVSVILFVVGSPVLSSGPVSGLTSSH